MQSKLILTACLVGAVLSASIAAQAAYECPVRPTEDITITSQMVQVTGTSGDLTITPAGEVNRQGKALALSGESRQQAQQYQAALRKDFPMIEHQAQQQLDKASTALDKVIVKQLGEESKVRSHLQDLSAEMRKALALVLEKRDANTLIFHHSGIAAAEKAGREKVESALGAVLQDSLNEMGAKSFAQKGENPLQSMLGGVGDLQNAIRNEWKQQEQGFRHFGQETCDKIIRLEEQREKLLSSLPK